MDLAGTKNTSEMMRENEIHMLNCDLDLRFGVFC